MTSDYNPGDNPGEYEIDVEGESETGDVITEGPLTFTYDNEQPDTTFESHSDGDYISEDNPDLEASFEDTVSGLSEAWIHFDPSGDEHNETESFDGTTDSQNLEIDFSDHDFDDLDDGSYDVDYGAVDEAGNKVTGTWELNVDTEYDGDSNPSFSIEGEEGGIVEFDDDVDMDVDFDSADSESETTATCVIDGEDIDSDNFDSADDGDDELTCEIDHDSDEDYFDEEVDVRVDIEDEAGNTAESDSQTVAFDAYSPSVTDLEPVSGLDTFNNDFDVEFSVSDSATSVEEIEYFFDDNTDEGEGNTQDYSSDQIKVDTGDLSSGEKTLYVRARDEANRWSSTDQIEFEFYPNQDPEVSINAPDDLALESGETGEFNVGVENTGEFLVETMDVSIESSVITGQDTVENLEPGESVTLIYDVNPSEDDIGDYTVDIKSESPQTSASFNYRVSANPDQKSSIQSNFDDYQSKLESLEANISEIENGLSEEQSTELTSNVSEFRNKVQTASSAIEEGKYYEAESSLNNIQPDFAKAKNSYLRTEQDYRASQRFKMMVAGFAVLIVGGIGGVFVLNRENVIDVDQRVDELKQTAGDMDIGSSNGSSGSSPDDTSDGGLMESLDIERFKLKISALLDRKKSEAEEFEWDGFKD